MAARPLRHGDRRRRAAVGGRAAARSSRRCERRGAPAGAPRCRRRRRLRPGPRAPRRAARPRAAALLRQRRGVGDVPRPRLHPRLGRARPTARRGSARPRGAPYAYLIYPHKPIVAYLPQTGRLLNEYCVEFPDETAPVRQRAAARLRRRARQVDGADRRRAAADRRRQHAPARPPGRPAAGPARPLAPARVGARARAQRAASGAGAVACPPRERRRPAFDLKHRSRALTEGPTAPPRAPT